MNAEAEYLSHEKLHDWSPVSYVLTKFSPYPWRTRWKECVTYLWCQYDWSNIRIRCFAFHHRYHIIIVTWFINWNEAKTEEEEITGKIQHLIRLWTMELAIWKWPRMQSIHFGFAPSNNNNYDCAKRQPREIETVAGEPEIMNDVYIQSIRLSQETLSFGPSHKCIQTRC